MTHVHNHTESRGESPNSAAGNVERLTTAQPDPSGAAGGGRIVALVSDLIFATKVTATGRFVGVTTAAFTSLEPARDALAEASGVLVDMHLPAETADRFIREALALAPPPEVVAFYSHVCTDLAKRAKAAGADVVLTRAKFSCDLGTILLDLSRRRRR